VSKPSIVPTPGRIVLYVLAEWDVRDILKRRGTVFHGNDVHVGEVYPAMVIKAWGSTPESAVNLKVMLDGDDNHWATSRIVGEGPGTYHWMDYQKGQAAKYEKLEAEVAAK
jgi:hypothetical protein